MHFHSSAMDATINADRSFPTEVVIEILTHLPIKYLAQCQLVCKDWGGLIHEHYLNEIHLDRSDAVFYMRNGSSYQQTHPNPDPFLYRHGCNGLLLLMRMKEKKHYIWNPAIHRSLELPDPHESSQGFSFSYVPAIKSYKIVSFYDGGCEVITPGDKVWRQLELPKIENLSSKETVVNRVSVIPCGAVAHYVLVTEIGEFPRIDIVSLELETESFKVSRFTDLSGQLSGWTNYWDLDWDGKLGFAEVVGENLEVIVLEDYKSGRWCEKKRVINLSFSKKSMVIPLFVEKGEIWFWLKEEKIFKYTVETRRCTDVVRARSLYLSSKVLPYKPSLIKFKGMVPDNPTFDRLRSYIRLP